MASAGSLAGGVGLAGGPAVITPSGNSTIKGSQISEAAIFKGRSVQEAGVRVEISTGFGESA